MQVKIKRLHPQAVIPTYAKAGDAGMDLVATSIIEEDDKHITYGTGLAFEIPIGFAGFLFPRSSVRNKDLILANSVGVSDSPYRGEVQLTFFKKNPPAMLFINDDERLEIRQCVNKVYAVGERVAQIIIMPVHYIEFYQVGELSTTDRGTGGFGSTGA